MEKGLLRRNPAFRNLWLGKTGSIFGDWFNQVALAHATLVLTGSAAAMGFVLLCRTLPAVLLGPIASPLIDRCPKKRILLLSDLARAVFSLLFAAAFAWQAEWLLYVGAILLGLAGILFNPAENAAISLIVAQKDLAEANAIRSGTAGIVMIAGAFGGGIVSAALSPIICFAINSASYLWSACCIYRTDWTESMSRSAQPVYFQSLREGFQQASRNRIARAIILIGISWGIAGGGYYLLVPLLGTNVYQLGGLGIGLLYAIDGLGVVCGAYLVKRFIGSQLRRAKLWYGIAYLGQAVFLGLLAQFSLFWAGALLLFMMRVCSGLIIPLDTYLLQIHSDQEVRGRVFALHESTYLGVMQLSYVLFGTAFEAFSIPAVGILIGLVSFLCGLSWLREVKKEKQTVLSA